MNNKKIILILSIFILFAFTQSVVASDVDTNSTSDLNTINYEDTSQVEDNSNYVSNENNNQGSLTLENDTVYYGSQAHYYLKDSNNKPIANSTVGISVNGMDYNKTTDNDGIASMTIKLTSNNQYNITAIYNSTVISKDTLNVLPTITGQDIEKIFRNDTQYSVKITDSTGDILTNTNVTFNINGVIYTRTSDKNGIANLNINLNPGSYIVTSTNSITGEAISNNIIVKATVDQNKDLIKYFRNTTQYQVRTLDETGNLLANQNVTFNINGVFYTRTSNEKAIASLNINLNPGKYTITTKYRNCEVSNSITVLKTLTVSELIKVFGTSDKLEAKLVDDQGSLIANQNVTFNINGVFYDKTTNSEGIASLNINLNPGEYIATTNYKDAFDSAKVIVLDSISIKENATNEEIQNSIKANSIVKFTGNTYNNVSLNIPKNVILTSDVNTTLNGKLNTYVLSIDGNGVSVKNLNINGNNGTGIIVNNVENTVIENNEINNLLDTSQMSKYNSGNLLLPGNGIEILNSKNTVIENNKITYFYNGIYLNGAKYTNITTNTITKNNFGVEFDVNVANTTIFNNDINENIGFKTMDMIEGPYGYGISIRHSGVNITVNNNRINDNYMGVFIDAKNCSGIVITSNEISNSTIEGLTVNENYTYAPGAVLVVENNAIYNNAKGPSLIILGEVSANPNGIYGPGEWNDSLKLQLGPNWYGTNKYTTWGENHTGPGTICPRIHTTLIPYNITYISAGKYEVTFYNNGSIASKLPDLTTYFVLNYYTDKQEVVEVLVHQGKATFEFQAKNYYSTDNIIEGFSVFEEDRPKSVIYTYNVPDSEIPL